VTESIINLPVLPSAARATQVWCARTKAGQTPHVNSVIHCRGTSCDKGPVHIAGRFGAFVVVSRRLVISFHLRPERRIYVQS
jgi:hypothetical protein